jgi:hypothetical protein
MIKTEQLKDDDDDDHYMDSETRETLWKKEAKGEDLFLDGIDDHQGREHSLWETTDQNNIIFAPVRPASKL